ncbi:S8 family serine peptidase [Bianquea renquensis]|uniref:S8 family serine peptidase n=1 Tax=Bianquea renquensis TaxID=2763661 RepID=A0A926I272_9FIRM|nr:S8 family serine peptidase [Bianquea renquensis]MBC8544188.1 S8 family serine peptidase [Bianquea renquensis]
MRRSKRRFGDRILGILLTFTICFSGSSGLAFGAEQPDTDGFMAPGAASTADTESDALDVYYKDTAEQSVGQVIGSADFTEVDGSDSSRIDGFRKELEAEKPVEDAEISDDEIVNAILVLDSKSLLERGYEASEIPENFWAGLMEFWMNQKQNNVADEVQNTFEDITITYYYTIGICGIGITTPYKNINGLKELDGVQDVILSPLYEVPGADESNNIIGATAAWQETGYTGKGTKIAIIDTGLDLDHPSFQGGDEFETTADSLTVEKVDNVLKDLNVSSVQEGITAEKLYRSNKVPFAFNYIDASLRVDHNDANGSDHGTHVAGIAAANKISTTSISGVAPDAQLVIMKVFGNRGGAYFSDIMAAMEDAIRLGCDSINISIGSAAGFTNDEEEIQEVFARICDTDVVVAVAAGNDYNAAYGNPTGTNYNLTSNPDNGLVTSPGVYTNATTVASMDNASEFFTVGQKNITFNDSAQTDGTAFMKNFAGGQEIPFAVVGNYGAEVEDFEEAEVNGKIALVQRGGGITFMKKQENAQAAGAVGVIVYNSVDGTTSMKINDGEGYIPCISISKILGEYMIEQYYNGTTTLTIGIGRTEDALKMSTFSSWGTTSSLNLKPDLTAVGGNVLSTTDGGLYGTKTGTSMASPQIAGAAALVKQYLRDQCPELSEGEIHARTNQLLLSTAIPCREDNGTEYSPRKQGAGLVNVGNALGTEAYLSVESQSGQRPKVELWDDPQKTGSYQYSFTVSNMTEDSLAYLLSNSLLTNGYRAETDENGETYDLLSESDMALSGTTSFDSAAMGYYYDVDDDKEVDTRDIRTLMLRETYSNREAAMADLDQDGDLCDDQDIMLFLDNLSGLKEDLELDREALIVPGNETATVNVKIDLTEDQKVAFDQRYPNGIYVEGFTYLNSLNEDGIGLSLPYLGFYGDWAQAPIFDAHDHYYETEGKVNSYGTYLWTEESILGVNPYVETGYDAAHNAISDMNTLDVLESALLRNVKNLKITVTDTEGNALYSHEERYVTKALYSSSTMKYRVYRSPKLWDGTGQDGEFLENNTVVNLNVEAELDYKGNKQSFTYPITIDTEKPTLLSTEVVTDSDGRIKLRASFRDNQYIAAVIFKSANGSVEYERYAIEQSEAGETITGYEFDVTEYDDDFMMILVDYAMNQVDYDIDMGIKDNGVKEPVALEEGTLYGFNMGETSRLPAAMVKAPLQDVSQATVAANLNGIYAAEYLDGYVITFNALKELNVYTPQGTYWSQSKIRTLDCDVYDMTYNYEDHNLYAITYHDEKVYLSTIDIFDGTVNDIGAFGKGMATLGCTTEGQLYALSKAGELCKVNKADATSTVVGKVSETEDEQWVSLNYRQSMAYDHNTGKMYWYAFCYNGTTGKLISHLSEVNLDTGATAIVGEFDEACEVAALFIPYDGDLEITPTDTVTAVTLDQNSVALFPGQETRIFAAVTPWNAKNTEVEWTSEDPAVATVTNGRITAVAGGDTIVRATVKGTDISAECKVKVIADPEPFYGYLLLDWHDNTGDGIIQIDVKNPIKYKKKADILQFVYAGEYVDGFYYCYDSNGYFYRVDPEEWIYNTVGKADGKVVEMTYDYATNTMYGISSTGHSTALVRIDMNTGETTEIGSQDTKIVAMASVPTAGDAATGFTDSKLYAINEDCQLVTLSKDDGSATVDANSDRYGIPDVAYVQSMTYDYNTGYIYWAQVYQSQNSSLYVLDLDGQTMYYAGVIGKVGSQVSGLVSIPKEGTVPDIPYVPLEGIALSAQDCVMVKGGKLQIRAKMVPYNATSRNVSWSSDKPDVVDIDEGGVATAYNVGTATITCTALDEETRTTFTETLTVTVTEPIDTLSGFLLQDYETNNYNAWIHIDPVNPWKYTAINASTPTIGAGTYYNGWLYGYDNNYAATTGLRNFYKIDPQTGEAVKLGTIQTKVSDMAFDYSSGVMYAITDDTQISMVDTSNGEMYPVLTQEDQVLVALTVDEKGTVYVIGRKAGSTQADASLYTADLTAGTLTKIGDTGQKAVMEQSMTYDFENGYIYWAQAWAKAGEGRELNLCIVNPKNGYASVIGKIGESGSEVSALYCDSPDEPQAPYVELEDIHIGQGAETDLIVGGELQLQVSADPIHATNKDYQYTTDQRDVATVSETGVIKAVGKGTATITVSATDSGKTMVKTIKVNVLEPPEKMVAFLIEDRLFEGNELNSFITFPLAGSEEYEEETSFDKQIIAGERYDGNIYAYTSDLQFIKIDEGSKEYDVIGEVKDKIADMAFDYSRGIMFGLTYLGQKLVEIDLSTGNWYEVGAMTDGEGAQVKVNSIACDERGTLYGITSDGKFYAIDETGKATLISETMLSSSLNYESDLTYDPDTAMLYWSQISRTEQRIYIINPRTGATIGMYPIGEEGAEVSLLYADSKTALTPPEAVPVDAIVLSNTTAQISKGSTLALTATVLPVSVAVDKTVRWESSDPTVAGVDEKGNVTGIQSGTATITAKNADGTVTATCDITVVEGGDLAYGYSVTDGSWVSFDLSSPDQLTKVADGDEIVCATYADGLVYAYLKGGKQLVKFDPDTVVNGSYVYETVGAAQKSTIIKDIAYDKKAGKLYGISMNKMFEIDMATGAQTALYSGFYFGVTGMMLYTMASDDAGTIYAISSLGALCSLDQTTGCGEYVIDKNTKLDGTSLNGSNNSMAFGSDGTLYWAATTTAKGTASTVLNKVDLATGKVSQYIGSFGGEDRDVKLTGMYIK